MGISILGGGGINEIIGSLSVISGTIHATRATTIRGSLSIITGEFQAVYPNYIIGPLSSIEGDVHGDQNNSCTIGFAGGCLRNIDDAVPESSFRGYSSANKIEGDICPLDPLGDCITATSNCIVLGDDLHHSTIQLFGGGSIADELELVTGEISGTVPSIGTIEHTSIILTGTLYGGIEVKGSLRTISGDLEASVPSVCTINSEAKLSILQGNLEAIVPIGAELLTDLAVLTGTITAHTDTSGQITGTIITLEGNIHTQTEIEGDIATNLKTLSGYMSAIHSTRGDIDGNLSILIPTPGFKDGEAYDYRVLRFIRGETR